MFPVHAHSKGGQVRAKQQREEALKKYYASPNVCKNCNKIINVPDGTKIRDTRTKQFCNHTCAAAFNNKKRDCSSFSNRRKMTICQNKDCKKEFHPATSVQKFCSRMCKDQSIRLPDITKAEAFARNKSWQGGRTHIRRDAIQVYYSAHSDSKCMICGYSKHIHVSHIKSVSSFPDTAMISEINAITNLMGLCPTHHWEFDHDALELESIEILRSCGVKI